MHISLHPMFNTVPLKIPPIHKNTEAAFTIFSIAPPCLKPIFWPVVYKQEETTADIYTWIYESMDQSAAIS